MESAPRGQLAELEQAEVLLPVGPACPVQPALAAEAPQRQSA
ncbi:MAG: hypothetical protein ACE5JM_15340 [Armatimonadota bacterium]